MLVVSCTGMLAVMELGNFASSSIPATAALSTLPQAAPHLWGGLIRKRSLLGQGNDGERARF